MSTVLAIAACSGDSATEPSESNAPTTYSGVFATFNESGSITLVTGNPATGTLVGASAAALAQENGSTASLAAGASVALTGTYNAGTSTFSLTGGGYAVQASIDASAQVTGTIATPSAPTGGSVVALSAASATSRKTYCGKFSQTNQKAGQTPETGTLNVAINNTVIRGTAIQTGGDGAGPEAIVLSGTYTNSTINVSWNSGYGTATGVFNPNPVGTFQNQDGISGVWFANPC
ncbi:MAG TPA: hypothetical protein VG916_01720 [Gemmatimonadaceae bacterium]|nr:hypothetical protein [Gemmatimonadaceae bacterium]